LENQVLRKRWRYLLPLALIIVLVPACAATPTAKPETVLVADRNLGAALLNALGKPPGEPIYAEELAGLTELTANYANITNLSGIEHCPNLIKLDLAYNYLTDLSPLAALVNLTTLDLSRNQIGDVAPLLGNSSLGEGDQVDLKNNNLDLSENSENMADIRQLEGRGVKVYY
jgi:Leucine-rich repeat (LRR) protein